MSQPTAEERRQRAVEFEALARSAFQDQDKDKLLSQVGELEDLLYDDHEEVLRTATDALALATIWEVETVVFRIDVDAMLRQLADLRYRYRPDGQDDTMIHEAASIALDRLSTVCAP